MTSSGTIIDAVKCQASMLPPHVAEQYRCMLVWDKKTNRDVGWVMVRKKNVKGMTPDDMEADMSQCQWRTWNVSRREDESLGEEVFRDASLKEDAGTKLISADEASTSTSTEANKNSVPLQQVRSHSRSQLDERKMTYCSKKLPDSKTKFGNLAEIEICLLDKVEVKVLSVGNNSDIGIVTTGEGIIEEDATSHDTGRNICAVQDKLGKRGEKEEADADRKVTLIESSIGGVEKVKNKRSIADQFLDCSVCGKSVKKKSLTNHFRFVHKNRSALTNCNICRVRIAEVNLLEHRKSHHPDRFKYDLITCSGCQAKVRAVNFDNHECETVDESPRFAEQEDIPELLLETCGDCNVVFSVGEMRYHDCMMGSVVRIKKFRPKFGFRNTEVESKVVSDETVKGDENICEDCGKISDEKLQHKCRCQIKKRQHDSAVEKLNVDERTLVLLGNMKSMRDSVIKPMMVKSVVKSASEQTKEADTLTTSRGLLPGVLLNSLRKNPDLRITRISDPGESDYQDKKMELHSSLNLTNFGKCVAKVNEGREPAHIGAICNQNPARKTQEESRTFAMKMNPAVNLSAIDTVECRSIMTSAILTDEPPQNVIVGEILQFTVKLLDQNNTSLLIQSACLTASTIRSSVLQFRLQLVQPDGSVTLQPLWLSICSSDKPAELLKCLLPGPTPCRLTGRGQLQFVLRCDQHCQDKVCRFKLVVATKQLVLCYSREMFVQKKLNGQE